MKTIATSTLSLLLAASLGAASDRKPAPPYDLTTEFKAFVVVEAVRDVPKGSALDGIHLTVKSKNDTFDVYVGPTAFVKIFDVEFKKGEEIELTACKVKFEGESLALAREIRIGHVTLVLRDATGWPSWDWTKPLVPTGL